MKRKVDFDWYCKTKKDVINNAAYELIVALTAKSAPPRKFELSIPQWDDLMIANIVENSSPLIIVAAGTLDAVLFPTLKPIDIEFAHVAPDTLKTLDQLTICHEIHLLQFMASFYHRRCPNERTAPCQLRSGMGLNQFFADF